MVILSINQLGEDRPRKEMNLSKTFNIQTVVLSSYSGAVVRDAL